ncbi:P-loop containing nucleoside triphosphate hydrolase protein [Apodospora peruviana]|uniref:P-loop containing nucleoside triphosphate hydrolase protein n=1 Tax=Apodospora peruviana TaxID=516989 RepID=A0AAE0ILA7_9PEZI|nr:P-loop containing nucleoside triphosphate hydrolase protein [Apodospora peruviana]
MDMEGQVSHLVDTAWDRFLMTPEQKRLIIAIGGIPGSGKTTLSKHITTALNTRYEALHPGSLPIAIFVPMDGYHLTRAQLSAMPDPVTAHARRGAEFTFDGEGFRRLVQALREPLSPSSQAVFAPSFDHAVKDPKEDDIAISPTHRIVVLEGNYVLLDKEPWRMSASMFDIKCFVDVDFSVARKRLAVRHLAAGLAVTAEEADRRAVENDLPNSEEVVRLLLPPDMTVVSREDEAWAAS